jgi:hypothetical protein
MFHVHVPVNDHGCMTDIEPSDRSISDEQIVESRPRVRFLMLQRMEAIWQQVEDHLDPEKGSDPRWAEIGVRLLDRYGKLYGLDKPKPVSDDEDDLSTGVDRQAVVLLQLEDIRKKMAGEQGVDQGQGQ